MSDEKVEFPFTSPAMPEVLAPETKFKFNCYKGISCFNACCKCADVTLAPYDVLRLKGRLGMTSEEFLNAHTVPFSMDQDGVPGIKMRTDDEGACLFMDPENGCTVYEDRPTVCRYYPIALLNMREKDSSEAKEQYSMIKEAHCMGHQEDREISVSDYRADQGCEEFDEHNRDWYQLILKKKSGGPSVGAPSEMSKQLFFMASYNTDMFRRFVGSDNFKATYDLPQEAYDEMAKDDLALLKLGYRLMRQALFGEKTIPEQSGAWEKRMEERKEVWEARTNAEIEKRNQEVEQAMREDTLEDS